MTNEELLHEALVSTRRGLVGLPDTQVIERPGWWQVITPSLRQGGLNEVAGAALDEADADAVIDATIARYRELGVRFRWSVTPGSRPADLADRLARRGLTGSESRVMWHPCADAGLTSAGDGDIAAIGVDGVDAFTQVMAEGWESDPEPLHRLHRAMLAAPDRVALHLARRQAEPAGAAGVVFLPRSAYLLGAVVLPAFRGRGLYRALVAARLAAAAARGLPVATTQARAATSAPILERLGFQTISSFPVFAG